MQDMAKQPKNAVSPARAEDFPEWYQQVVRASDMAENAQDVRGCMVIKPWGYGLWEQMQRQLDQMFKDTGHQNAYFPLLIPVSYLEKEAEHAEGFATECAVVTHHRLEAQKDEETGKVKMVPTGKLTEPYVIRPTSETVIGAAFARWVQSYRDLPLLINQWANVMRWEMRPRLFLRTAEFLWQEGHTAHETKDEALEETEKMLRVYETFARDHLAIPVITGEKTENERFPGAEKTVCIEAMVQDRKAIQAGTSHYLGQNFSKAAGIEFAARSDEGGTEFAYTTSWGVSTRLIGTLLMAHADDDGAVMPPKVSPTQIVIIPVTPKEDTKEEVLHAAEALAKTLRNDEFDGERLRVHVDTRDVGGGTKTWDWIKKGVPIRVELGPRDIEKRSVAVTRRDQGPKEKQFIPKEDFLRDAADILSEIQNGLLERAREFRNEHLVEISSMDEFVKFFTPKNPDKPEIHGGFAVCYWAGSNEEEEKIAKEHKVTIRCIPDAERFAGTGKCILTGAEGARKVIFAKSY